MLTIEKRSSTLQRASVLTAAFVIGLVGSLGALYTIDPKHSATVVQTLESNTQEQSSETPTDPAASSTKRKEASVRTETSAWTQPASSVNERYQASAAKNEEKSHTQPAPDSAPAAEDPSDRTSDDSDVLDVPLLKLLLP